MPVSNSSTLGLGAGGVDGELGDGLLAGAFEGDFDLEFFFFFALFDFTVGFFFFTRAVPDFFDFPAFFCPASKDNGLKKKLIAKRQTPNLRMVTLILPSNGEGVRETLTHSKEVSMAAGAVMLADVFLFISIRRS
jgi:hypothetical protein